MHTPPRDFDEQALRDALESGWSLQAEPLTYQAVGFGSHHWEIPGYFISVNELRSDDTWGRLHDAYAAVSALQATGRDRAVAPLPACDGKPIRRLGNYAVAVCPFVDSEPFAWQQYRQAFVNLITGVHAAPPEVRNLARTEDYVIPRRDEVVTFRPGDGPFGRRAAELLTATADKTAEAFARYDHLVAAVQADPPDLVLTHGEPFPQNTLFAGGRWRLIDWDTTLTAPPERDLWDIESPGGTLHAEYTAATGTVLRPELLALYRLRWDLGEIAQCSFWFGRPHGDTDDDREMWGILGESLEAL
ncbi:phosphotransferase [Actinoplanes sp. TFC3]|uniref:phosphotransferase n=1 Tax=Actinoplanes sp. TFC3 TaxID=1710355 RepID=UPI0008296351|nr:phosphotransferase [Actinoplanes sp. TFC3]